MILDLGLPGMRGTKVLHELRAQPDAPPVVVVTGDVAADLHRLEPYGVAAVLHKPVEHAALLACIERLTGG